MGDPLAPSEGEGNSEGGGSARRIASREAKRAGITRPQLLEMSRPGALGTKEKTPMARRSSLIAARGLRRMLPREGRSKDEASHFQG